MKIDDRNAANLNPAGLDRTRSAELVEAQQGQRTEKPGGAAGGDRVSLSDLSARLRELSESPAAREQRIAALAAEFEAGRYEPDPDAVADAMIAEAELSEGRGGDV
jgi:negative regulator of flagellin synthesis FlgM